MPPGYRAPASASELLARYQAGERLFAAAQLRNVDLRGARLSGADLSRADLTGGDLSRAIIEDALFVEADLTRANLSDAKCHGADFTGAILSQALLSGAQHCKVARASAIYRGREEGVFAAYARVDEQLVSSLVALIRSVGARVFMDVHSIVPGDKWRPALTTALAEASVVVVFWCAHSAGSREVKKEYLSAHASGKRIIPLLLDDTPPQRPLTDYQWLDFRGTFASHDPSQTEKRFVEFAESYKRPRTHPPKDFPGDFAAFAQTPPTLDDFERRDLEEAQRQLFQAIVAAIAGDSPIQIARGRSQPL